MEAVVHVHPSYAFDRNAHAATVTDRGKVGSDIDAVERGSTRGSGAMTCDKLPCDTGLPCVLVSDLGASLLVFWPGSLIRQGETLMLRDAGELTVDAHGSRDDDGFSLGQVVQFPCHILEFR